MLYFLTGALVAMSGAFLGGVLCLAALRGLVVKVVASVGDDGSEDEGEEDDAETLAPLLPKEVVVNQAN